MSFKNIPIVTNIHQFVDYYVYALVKKSTKEIFYIGKGQGNRCFEHIKDTGNLIPSDNEVKTDLKLETVSLLKKNDDIDIIIIRHGLTEETAYEVEATAMDMVNYMYSSSNSRNTGKSLLANKQTGWRSNSVGLMTVPEVENMYITEDLTMLPPNCVIININNYSGPYDNLSVRRQVEGDWVIGKSIRANVEYILAAKAGKIIGIFKIKEKGKWTNPDYSTRRWRTELEECKNGDVIYTNGKGNQTKYEDLMGKSYKWDIVRGAQNPIRKKLNPYPSK